jgi:hypothetical protein
LPTGLLVETTLLTMMKIDSYNFGQIVINGKSYSEDVIVFPDRVRSNWWRKSGHQVCVEDLNEVLEEKPKTLIIGTGAYGAVEVVPETEAYLRAEGIRLIAERTEEAVRTFNKLVKTERVAAGLHLTC